MLWRQTKGKVTQNLACIATKQGDDYYSNDLAFKDHVNIDVS